MRLAQDRRKWLHVLSTILIKIQIICVLKKKKPQPSLLSRNVKDRAERHDF